ncbi:MAG: phosphate ABC transporter substrate-binding protein PstS [Acidobacteriaceae bacterium]|nr:phosphate ABC transporter substrate-binding protein PstS [Acidobacteriaceae bacterium]
MTPVHRLRFAVVALLVSGPLTLAAQSVTSLKAAGATFPYPLYSKWFSSYHRANPEIEITYDATGSEAGVRRLLTGEVDFAASDNPQIVANIAPRDESRYLLLPSIAGAVVPIVNLPGVAADVRFTPAALSGIYLGKIRKWNDPLLKSANKGVVLPDLDIVVIHRADGSGTTFAWTDFLSKTSPDWKATVGCSMTPNWPVGRGAEGNGGVAKLVKELEGSIGYVEFIYALQNHLSFGSVRNEKGRFVAADLDSIEAAATEATAVSGDLKASLVNAPGAEAYPIATFTWFVVPAHIEDSAKRRAIKDFLAWMAGAGQRQAAALGYVALPKTVIEAEGPALDKIN